MGGTLRTFEKDHEMLALKERSGANYLEIARLLGLGPSAAAQRFCGYLPWRGREREFVARYLKRRMADREAAEVAA